MFATTILLKTTIGDDERRASKYYRAIEEKIEPETRVAEIVFRVLSIFQLLQSKV
jgi:hypothetical protein